MAVEITPLIAALKQAVPLELRSAPDAPEYLEGVLARQHLKPCHELLVQHFGAAAKDFGKRAAFAGAAAKCVERVGGIQTNQCLFLSMRDGRSAVYAALWPWSSDPMRVTLKVGIVAVP